MFKLIYYLKCILSFPHLICYKLLSNKVKDDICSDVDEMNRRCNLHEGLLYYLVHHPAYRNLFYYRMGPSRKRLLLSLLLPPYKSFEIPDRIKEFGKAAFVLNHPYSTIINARKIGDHFTVCQLTTIGNKQHGQNHLIPEIGDNVSLGANVNIIGDVKIGSNVIVGAGSVVVHDVPDNCVVAGNPARIIRRL